MGDKETYNDVWLIVLMFSAFVALLLILPYIVTYELVEVTPSKCLRHKEATYDFYINLPESRVNYTCDWEWNGKERCKLVNKTVVFEFNVNRTENILMEMNANRKEGACLNMTNAKYEKVTYLFNKEIHRGKA